MKDTFKKFGTEFKIYVEYNKIQLLPTDLENVLYYDKTKVSYHSEEENFYLSMPLFEGKSMDKILNESISFDMLKRYIRSLMIFKDRIIILNGQDFFHNNITPKNLIFDHNDEIKLVNFFLSDKFQVSFNGKQDNDIINVDRIIYKFMKLHEDFIVLFNQKFIVKTLSNVDLNSYLGLWYELYKIPQWFEHPDGYNTTAEYILDENGILVVKNTTYINGEPVEIIGTAKSEDESNSKLIVNFSGYGFGNYYIIKLGNNYEYSIVTNQDGTALWILSRTKEIDENTFSQIITFLLTSGYNLDNLKRTQQINSY